MVGVAGVVGLGVRPAPGFVEPGFVVGDVVVGLGVVDAVGVGGARLAAMAWPTMARILAKSGRVTEMFDELTRNVLLFRDGRLALALALPAVQGR